MLEYLALLCLALLLLSFVSASSVSVTLSLNTTTPQWDEAVNASGYATVGGNPWQGNITVKVDGSYACSANTSNTGFYNCSFTAPVDLGRHTAQAIALSSGQELGASSPVSFWVVYRYGSEKEYGSVASITFPAIIQQMSGKIDMVLVTLKIWR